jgi:hypothetical protein
MREGLRTVLGTVLVSLSWLAFPVVGSDLSQFLHSVFENQYGRPPSGTESNYYANISRTDGPLESLMSMVASDDYFLRLCQGKPDMYVTRMYETFLQRDPTGDERQYWTSRVPRGSSNTRLAFVREFCRVSNLVYYAPSTTQYQSVPARPAASQSETANTLAAKAAQLNSQIQVELGGTRFGQDLLLKSALLSSACIQYRDAVDSPQSTRDQIAIAAVSVERALQGVEGTFRTIPGVSVNCQVLLRDVSDLAASTGRYVGTTSPPSAATRSAMELEADHFLVTARQFASAVLPYRQQNASYATIYRDATGLVVQAESLQQLASTGAGQRDLQRITTAILNQARQISGYINQTNVRVQQGWWNVQHELEQLAATAGCGGDIYTSTDQPVIISHPAWAGLPVQPVPSYQSSNVSRRLISLADQLVDQIEKYVDSLRPIAPRIAEGSRMIDQSLDLRNQILVLRQHAATGGGRMQLQNDSRDALRQYRDVASPTFLKLVGLDPSLNSPMWVQIGQSVFEIDRSVSDSSH